MWIIGKDGHAANLERVSALCIQEMGFEEKTYNVNAMLPGIDDSGFNEGCGYLYGVSVTLKEFDNRDDAEKYIADLVEKLNAEKSKTV